MIFCSDFRQLPPVNATPVYKFARNASNISGNRLWQSLSYFQQANVAFSDILTSIGDSRANLYSCRTEENHRGKIENSREV